MDVYREILPDSYLLILDGNDHLSREDCLKWALQQALASGKPNIWVDCNHLEQLPTAAVQLLSHFYGSSQRRQIQLVLCHLSETASRAFRLLPTPAQPPMVEDLLAAAIYCRSQRPRRRVTPIAPSFIASPPAR